MTNNQDDNTDAQRPDEDPLSSDVYHVRPASDRPEDISGAGQATDRQNNPHADTGASHADQESLDTLIKHIIDTHLLNHEHINVRDINISVNNGEVTLTGTADDEHIKRIVEETVASIPGVAAIHNRIQVRSSGP